MLPIALVLGLALAATEVVTSPAPTPTSQATKRIVIPDEIFIDLSVSTDALEAQGDDAEAIDLATRAQTWSRVAFGDDINLAGHIEAVDGNLIRVVGRQVNVEFAQFRGGVTALAPGELVMIEGVGTGDGSIQATKVDYLPRRDPARWSELVPELQEFKQKFWAQAKRYEDPLLDSYLADIAERLMPEYVPTMERRIQIRVVEDPSLNAFALPDGTIVLHTGIIARMENEAQLASILGHEIAHVTQRHTLRAMDKQTEHKLIGWGSMLAALALGVSGEADAAQGVQLMSSAWFAGYSRGHEDESDQVGLRHLYLAGYDVREAAKVWETFQALYGSQSQSDNFFYGSHSTARARQHHLRHEVWKSYEPGGLVGGHTNRARFLEVTSDLVRDNALLDLEQGRTPWAEWGLAKSLAIDPDDAQTHAALGQLARRRGRHDEALDAVQHALALDPENADAHRELGKLLKRLGRHEEAREAFGRYLSLNLEADDAKEIRDEL